MDRACGPGPAACLDGATSRSFTLVDAPGQQQAEALVRGQHAAIADRERRGVPYGVAVSKHSHWIGQVGVGLREGGTQEGRIAIVEVDPEPLGVLCPPYRAHIVVAGGRKVHRELRRLVDRLGDERLEHCEQPEPANERVGLRPQAARCGAADDNTFRRVEVAQRDLDA